MSNTNKAEENYYQPLFNLMSEHNLTLLEGELQEIIDCVNDMQNNNRQSEIDELIKKQDYYERIIRRKEQLRLDLTKEVERLSKEREWINFSDKQPDINDTYIVCDVEGIVSTMQYDERLGIEMFYYTDDTGVVYPDNIMFWQPLPKKYLPPIKP